MDRSSSSRWAGILLLLVGAALAPARAVAAEDWDAPEKKWTKGPVSYIVTEEEEKAFRKAETEEDRKALIDAFWARRDPSAGTPENEFRDRFYQRVESADSSLRAQGIPAGWKSELGRVLILLGQPATVKFEAAAADVGGTSTSTPSRYGGGGEGGDAGSAAPEAGGKARFRYPDLTRLGLPANLDIEFAQEGLAFRLLTRVNLATEAILGLDTKVLQAEFPTGAAPEKAISLVAPPAAAPPPVPTSTGSIPRDILLRTLDAGEAAPGTPFHATSDFYKAQDGRAYLAVTLSLDDAAVTGAGLDPGALHPIAALRDTTHPKNLLLYDADLLFGETRDGADGRRRFQAGDALDAGTYRLVTGFITADGAQVSTQVQEIVVPDFSVAEIQLSSVTLAQLTETVPEVKSDLKRPFILGKRRVIPRVDSDVPLNGVLTFYYQVYNPTSGADGKPNLQISYNFFRKVGERYQKAGTAPPLQGVKDAVQIYELPVKGWPKGDYKLKVTVTDTLNGAFVERETFFQVG
jgi:GWxTD domain-containing protein